MGQTATAARLRQLAAELRLSEAAFRRALELANVEADRNLWLARIDKFLMSLGGLLVVAGIAAFFAWNWADLARLDKFALLQGGVLVAAVTAWRLGIDSVPGRSALLAAAVLVGVLLAVFGQTYQTGADPYSLFLGWAILILPWVCIGRQASLWMLLLVLLNLGLIMFWTQVLYPPSGLWQLSQLLGPLAWLGTTIFDSRLGSWLFALNVSSLIAWELLAGRGIKWMQVRWLPRIMILGCLTVVLIPTLIIVITGSSAVDGQLSAVSSILFAAMVVGSFYYYQYREPDLLVLTWCLLGCILVITSLFARSLASFEGGLLLAGVVVALTAGAAFWLRQIAQRWNASAASESGARR